MKQLLSTLCLSFLTVCLVAQGSINFIDNNLDDALSRAGSEEKIIFVDAYTTWCGPCKMMDRDVFADAQVAEFFNDKFVNLKLDMEKGAGTQFRRKYGVRGFPSFLFLNAAGAVVHRGIGYQPPEQFMGLAKAALDPTKQSGGMADQYAMGDRNPAFLQQYANALLQAGDPKGGEIGAAYLQTQDNWNSKENMTMVVRLMREYDDPYFQHVVEKRHLYIKEFGTDQVDGSLRSMIERHLLTNMEKLDLKAAKAIYEETFPTNNARNSYSLFEMSYYKSKGNDAKYVEKAKSYVKESPDLSSNALNSLAWGFYEDVNNKKDLKAAVKWAKKSVALNSNSFNTDTLAALYYKLGKKKPALRWAEKSIELAQAAGMDYEETSTLVTKINAL